jgi:hypothetical protein
MKFSPDLLKMVDHCQYRSFITNRYTGTRIAVDCGQCDYCIPKRAQKASMRVKTAGSAFKYSYFVTLTYDNEHIPLFNCKVLHSEYEDVVGISGDIHFGDSSLTGISGRNHRTIAKHIQQLTSTINNRKSCGITRIRLVLRISRLKKQVKQALRNIRNRAKAVNVTRNVRTSSTSGTLEI